MSLKCGIVGLPNVGKSTLFNALTKAGIAAENYPFCTIEPNTGVVEVPDPRLADLAAIVKPERVLPAIVEFVDIAGLVAGAMSMAAGEYVSVHSQADTEKADLERERRELAADPQAEQRELATIYERRGLAPALAQQVAQQLMAHDALGAHARDELEVSQSMAARPVQAAFTSAASFAGGAALPLLVAVVAPAGSLLVWVSGTALVFLALMGALAARIGGARVWVGGGRVTFWGALAMAITAGVGALFGAPVG